MLESVPPLDGALLVDEATRQRYAQDYGQIIHKQPFAVLVPGSVDDIARIVRFARRFQLRIVARGNGHLPFGQAQIADGVVVDMRALRSVHAVESERVHVDAGADWHTVVEAAGRRGLMPPVLPAYLSLTVGGTLAIGGVGPASFRHGAQVDHVLSAEVVTGEGEVVTSSSVTHPDLFAAVLAGQGQCGILTGVVMRLVPAPAMVREYTVEYPDLLALIADGFQLANDGRFDGVAAFVAPARESWTYTLVATSQFTPPDAPDDAALMSGLNANSETLHVRDVDYVSDANAMPDVPIGGAHADLGLCLPGSTASSFLADALPRFTPDALGSATELRLSFWKRAPFGRPLFRVPATDIILYVVIRREATTDPDLVARLLHSNRALFESNRALGGTHYPYSALPLSRHDWRHHYGSRWAALVSAKRRYDPDNVFASGPDLFHGATGDD